jgi:hypothetical protein
MINTESRVVRLVLVIVAIFIVASLIATMVY